MAQKVITVLTDDFDGKELPEDTRALNVTVGRSSYSLYLSDKNLEKFLNAVDPFVKNADKVATGATNNRPKASRNSDATAVRDWAKANGMEVSERGRISKEVQDAYDAKAS